MDEDKLGIYASSALAGVLVVLSVVLLGVAGPGGVVGGLAESYTGVPEEDGSSGGGLSSGSSNQPTAEPPDGLSFLCGDSMETQTTSSSTQLSADHRDEAEAAAKSYVMSAYGFEGSGAAGYENGVEEQVVDGCFWGSAAAEDANNMEEAVRQGSPESASSSGIIDNPYFAEAFVLFDIGTADSVEHDSSGAEYLKTEGTAVWITRGSEELYPREQTLTLVKKKGEGEWKVLEGGTMPPNSYGHEHAVDEKIEEIDYGEPPGGPETTRLSTG